MSARMTEGAGNIKWICPDTRQKAVQRARYRANAARWDINIAIFLFGITIAVFIMSSGGAGLVLTAFIAISGLMTAWLWGRRKAAKYHSVYIEEELSRCPDEWRDYYKDLRIGPGSDNDTVRDAYENISYVYSEVISEKTKLLPLYSKMYREATEAFRVLSNPDVRVEYDRIYWLKYNGGDTCIEESVKSEMVDLSDSINREVSDSLKIYRLKIPVLSRAQQRIISAVVAFFLIAGICGTSLAFTHPDHALAAPFRGTAKAVAQASSGLLELIDDVRSIGAMSERQVISTTVMLMRIEEGVKYLIPVEQPTNDMASFPSPANSLYPEYVDRRYSQFEYTVDSNGIVTVHTDVAATDPLLDKIRELIQYLEY